MTESDQILLEGIVSVEAAVTGNVRPVHSISIAKGNPRREIELLLQKASARNIPVQRKSREELDILASGSSHGGILASVGPRTFTTLKDLITPGNTPFIIMLDGIEDPFNFGFAIRTLYAAGATGLVVRPRNWTSATATVTRSSAGASELIPTAIAEDPDEAAELFRNEGLTIGVMAKQPDSLSLYQADLTVPLFLLIGGERRGVKRSFLGKSDLVFEIPYGRKFSRSLGAASAAGIIGFEVMRQRLESRANT